MLKPIYGVRWQRVARSHQRALTAGEIAYILGSLGAKFLS